MIVQFHPSPSNKVSIITHVLSLFTYILILLKDVGSPKFSNQRYCIISTLFLAVMEELSGPGYPPFSSL